MDPQLVGTIAGVAGVGAFTVGKVVDNLFTRFGNGRNGKVETLLGQLVDLTKEECSRSIDQSEILRTTLRELEKHDVRTAKACDDVFRLLRKQ